MPIRRLVLPCLLALLGFLPGLLRAQVSISEFLASNSLGLTDSDGDRPDWIEIRNSSGAAVNLLGWSLTDDPALPRKWVFPSVSVPANGQIVVFASGKNRTNSAAPLHTSFSLSVNGEYLALFAPEASVPATEFAPQYPPQRADVSYGFRSGRPYYFSPPSPGAANTGGAEDFVKDTKFSRDRGVYEAPFDLEITCETVGASIRYTTNGAPPTLTTGFAYTGPIRIERSVVLRAAAFRSGLQPSDVDTHTYLFPADVIRQQPAGQVPWAEWPTPGSQAQDYDYGMDPRIVDSPTYRDQVIPALKALPTMSVVTTLSNLFNSSTGIFANPGQDGRAWERPASLELIHPDGTRGFQVDCGIRIRGGFSRSTGNPKHAFRFFFRDEYGASKLRYPLHEGGVEEFDALDLRTFQNYSWSFDPGGGANGVFIRDVFSRDSQLAMGQQGERGNYYHLYINGVYWGIFNSCERPEANYGEAYFGGRAEDYDVIKVEAGPYALNATDGNMDAWTRLYNLCRAITPANANTTFWRVQGLNPDGNRNPAYEVLLDVDNLIDYMLVIVFGGNLDAPISNFLGNTRPNNWYGLRDRSGLNGGFRFISHDAEHTLLDVNQNRVGPFSAGSDSVLYSNPQYLWQQLWQSPEFRVRIADRIQRHFFNGGALTAAAAQARFANRTNQLYLPVVAESARWGDSKQSTPLNRDQHWLAVANRIMGTYLPQRPAIVLNQLRNAALYPTLAAPAFSRFGGVVPAGTLVTVTGPGTGRLLYTLNGSDPRSIGGAENPGAQLYSAPIAIRNAIRLRARVSRTSPTNEWSALTEAVFYVQQDFSGLRFSEIHYHPAPAIPPTGFGEDDYEFLELKNAGPNPIDLSGVRLDGGARFAFPLGTTLAPGGFLVLAENPAAFAQRYPGRTAFGQFEGQLSNSGERLAVLDPAGNTVLAVDYGTALPWPTTPDGLGFSLVPKDPVARPAESDGNAWRASTAIGGSPGTDDAASGIVPVVVNEILSHTDLPALDSVELHNPGATAAPIGHWFLTDDPSQPRKYRFPSDASIPAGGHLVITEAAFNAPSQGTNAFRLSALGDEVFLFSADASGNLTGFSDGGSFGASFNGRSFNRHTNSLGTVAFVESATPTLGQPNSPLRIGPVVLQEIHYAPAPGEFPFVEVRNISAAAQPLFDPQNPANTWRIAGLDFDFPPGISLPPDGYAVVTEADPAVFRLAMGVPAGVPVFGPIAGLIQRNGERLELTRPDGPVQVTIGNIATTVVPQVVVDSVRYNDTAPWPVDAANGGVPLERRAPAAYADDPAAWRAALAGPTPGGAAAGNRAPRVAAGPDRELASQAFPLAVALEGSASDDGLPSPDSLVLRWSQVSGPRGVVFPQPGRSNAIVELPGSGTYVLRLEASDGERTVSDDVQVTVGRGGGETSLVAFGSTWRFFDQRTDLGTAWRERAFNDANWGSGRARLGYGGDGEVTTINGGPANDRNRTAYFRHRFNVADPAAITRLTVRVIRDDGAVVYLNGAEVFRTGMPEGSITFDTLANTTVGGADETTPFDRDIATTGLVAGENVIAVEVHQVNAGSSDLGLDLALVAVVTTGNAAPTVNAGPDTQVTLPAVARLRATFTDDGLPVNPGVPAFQWSRVSGPGTVSFNPSDSPATEATFSTAGTYVLRFSANDGALSANDTVTVTVNPGSVPAPVLGAVLGSPITLRFQAESGVGYTLRYRTTLTAGPWQTLQSIPAGAARTIEIPDPATDEARYYQVTTP